METTSPFLSFTVNLLHLYYINIYEVILSTPICTLIKFIIVE